MQPVWGVGAAPGGLLETREQGAEQGRFGAAVDSCSWPTTPDIEPDSSSTSDSSKYESHSGARGGDGTAGGGATVGERVSSGFLSAWVFLVVLAEASLIAAHYMAEGGGDDGAVAMIRTVSTAAPCAQPAPPGP